MAGVARIVTGPHEVDHQLQSGSCHRSRNLSAWCIISIHPPQQVDGQPGRRVRHLQAAIGSEGGLPLPSAHTTVRTVPYTAVQVLRCRSRS